MTCERIEAETETEAPSSQSHGSVFRVEHYIRAFQASKHRWSYSATLGSPFFLAKRGYAIRLSLGFLPKSSLENAEKKFPNLFASSLPNYFFYFFFVIFCYFSSDYRLKGSFLKILVWWKWQFHALLDWILYSKINFKWWQDQILNLGKCWCNLGNWSGISIESQDSIDIG